MAVTNTVFGKYAIGGFCTGLMAGGLMVFFLNVLGGGTNVALPFGFAVAGAVGAYTQLKDI